MVIIKQVYCYSCVAACIESFFSDHHKTITQNVMIHELPDLFFVNDVHSPPRIGAIDLANLFTIGSRLKAHQHFGFGFTAEEISVNTDIRSISVNDTQTLLITTRHQKRQPTCALAHCVRLKEIIPNEDAFWVMNPDMDISTDVFRFEKWTFLDLTDMGCVCYRLTLT